MVTWFKYKYKYKGQIAPDDLTYVCQMAVASIVVTLMMSTEVSACNGTTKDERIIKAQPSPVHILEGSNAMIKWTYCKTKATAIDGFIVYRQFLLHPSKPRLLLLSMDTSGNVFYKDKKGHSLWNRIDLLRKDHLITFIIKNASTIDSGFYRLEVRRIGYGDLFSKVHVLVESQMAIVPSHMPTPQGRTTDNTKSVRNLKPTSHRSEQRSVVILWTSVVTVTVLVLLITGILVYIKKRNLIKRAGDENQQEDDNVMITT